MKPDIIISVPKVKFTKEAVLASCCELASDNNSYLLRKSDNGKFFDVLIILRPSDTEAIFEDEELKIVVREFKNLLNEKQLQILILKNNMKICEEITYNALSNPILFKEETSGEALPESIARIIEESSSKGEESYLDDVLKIAVPWEEKNP